MSNLTRTETRRRAEQLTLHALTVELDLRAARHRDVASFPTTTTLRLSSTSTTTWLDFLGPRVHAVVVDGQEQVVRVADGRVAVEGLRTDGESTVVVRGEAAYSRTGEGMHRFVDPVDGETYLYTQYEPADARRVFACTEQPDLKAPSTFVVTAPAEWQVLSNSVAESVVDGEDGSRTWTFAPTPPLSTYITAVVAGPYHRAEGHWSRELADGSTLDVPLGLWCRASLAPYLDAEEFLEVTRQGLDLFHDAFDYPYPWGKYDQVLVPEYNLGAMENPGLVTFTEKYLFRSQATEAQREGRATTILHEMAHMWFGDLATMRWWDDLWLKESFADYMGTYATATATRFTGAWTSFALRRKAWAYRQDQLPTTHPVVADIPDLEAAKQNFDGITYAKGASVLKQLVAFVGPEAFLAGARTYFRRHEYGSTTLPDLLAALEEASGRDLSAWSGQWLQTTGPSTLTAELETAAGTVTALRVRQDDDGGVLRDHRLVVGCYSSDDDGALVRTHRFLTDVSGPVTELPEAVGIPVPDLVLVNDDDLTYAKVRLDERSTTTALRAAGTVEESLSRAVLWSALWNATRDGLLPAAAFLDAVVSQLPAEREVGIARDLLAPAASAVEHYLPVSQRDGARALLAEETYARLARHEAGSGLQLVWARAFADAAARAPEAAGRVRTVLAGEVPGLQLDPELRWSLWQALTAVGTAGPDQLDGELAREDTATTRLEHRAALAGRPDATVKAEAWASLGLPAPGQDAVLGESSLSNDEVDAVIAGLTQPLHAELLEGYVEPYFALLPQLWAERSIEIAERLVEGLYPAWVDGPEGPVEEHPVVTRTRRWLAEHEDAPAGLRRCLLEQLDDLERALRARSTAARPAVAQGGHV
ncbi:aminopeptidase N [Georgenia satyanarayanai]|uniref:aminopeptidase N n=1 Tax=Georgenia satyanarayanai TaxID=860221 RepID=UPI0020421F82|nr:aminopeptidase N [Georgenia satyanarayanai]MCM3659934.1 aminopeptidase N [Georgenia satyanarayanai]